jgi:hypothetical protein
MSFWLLNYCWASPAQWFLVPSLTELTTVSYCLTALGAVRTLNPSHCLNETFTISVLLLYIHFLLIQSLNKSFTFSFTQPFHRLFTFFLRPPLLNFLTYTLDLSLIHSLTLYLIRCWSILLCHSHSHLNGYILSRSVIFPLLLASYILRLTNSVPFTLLHFLLLYNSSANDML